MNAAAMNEKPRAIHSLLAHGFRPFFLASGFYAVVAMIAWLVRLLGLGSLPVALDPVVWHGHEMLYGFAAAAVAGFFLTVTPKWARIGPIRGLMLAGLVLVWLAGRIVHWTSALLPVGLVAAVDLLFLLLVLILVAQPILATGNRRQFIFVPVLGAYWLGNLLIHLNLAGVGGISGYAGLILGAYALATLIGIMGGRIIPSFTSNYLRAHGGGAQVVFDRRIDRLAMLATPTVLVADLFLSQGPVTGALFLALALVHLRRWVNWRPHASRGEPILWVLHAGYAWLIASFALIALADLGNVLPRTAAFHGLTVGAVGVLMIGVMSRAGLGHTGRPIKAAPSMVIAYLLLNGAALVRVIAPAVPGLDPLTPLLLSGGLWIGAFGLFVFVYAPVLLRPRLDRQPS